MKKKKKTKSSAKRKKALKRSRAKRRPRPKKRPKKRPPLKKKARGKQSKAKVKARTKAKKKLKKTRQKARSRRKAEPMARLLLPLGKVKEIFRTRYGFFLYDGSEFVVNTPETPWPWSNVLTNGDYGMIIAQAGGGLSFNHGMGNRITNWRQELDGGNYGKFIYIRDNETQEFWSATWKPVCKQPEFYEVRNGIGYTNITSKNKGIISSLIYYVAAEEPVEIWQMRIINDTDKDRYLSIFSFLEWDFPIPTGNREYDKLFVETSFDQKVSAIFAKTPDSEYAFHSVNHKVSTFTCGRRMFLGSFRDVSNPRCVEKGMCFGEHGRYNDPAAALHFEVELPARGEKELLFTVGVSPQKKAAEAIVKKYKNIKVIEEEFSRTCQRWTIRLNSFQITTPDEGANILTNKWLRYQAMSAGLGTYGSYQNPGSLINFKDHLINGLILLSVNPKYYKPLLVECAEKQFEDGAVIEEWDPKTGLGTKSESIEVPLWLVYSVCEYLKETKDFSILDEDIKFQDTNKQSLFAHCTKALDLIFNSIGKRGLPPMLSGDYMKKLDGLSKDAKGESIWLTQFLAYIVGEFINTVCAVKQDKALIANYESRMKKIIDKFKKIAWDNDRFIRGISHTGRGIGIAKGKNARLFLDTQAWAVIAGLCEKDDAIDLMNNVKANLYREHGPIMVAPPFDAEDEEVGTVSRLPKGIMENGGLSVEAACWTIWAETKLGRAANAWSIYTKLDPVDRSHKSDIYQLEPFVACEYVDGPDASSNGRARNSWYNRSAYWMFKVMVEDILGIKPTLEGLRISPCIPSRWRLFKVRRAFRNAYYTIEVINPRYVSTGIAEISVDGKKISSNIIPDFGDEKRHHVKVTMGKSK